MKASLGIDIGTSAVKVLLLGLDGEVLAERAAPHPTARPHSGWAEQVPEDWWRSTVAAVSEVKSAADAEIVAVGLTGQLNGFVLLDSNDRPLGDAPIWLDTRAIAETAEIDSAHAGILRERGVTRLSPIAVLPKLLWLARHEPERLSQTRSILLVKDFVLWKLTGIKTTDPSDAAATAMYDFETGDWNRPLLVDLDLDPELLPEIGATASIGGSVTNEAATETGIAAGTPVARGAGDVTALAVGTGAIEGGILGITLGTAGHVVLGQDAARRPDLDSELWCLPHANPDRLAWLGLVMSGGLSLSWMHEMFASTGKPLSYSEMEALAAEVPPGASGVTFLPFLEGAATPYGEPRMRGTFNGLSPASTAGHMLRSAMEGVAFNVRQCVEAFQASGAEITQVHLAEGGARVDLWCQIVADVLGLPVRKLEALNTSTLGAAMIAMVAAGLAEYDDLLTPQMVQGKRFDPDPATSPIYEAAYRRYCTEAEAAARLAHDMNSTAPSAAKT
ncbi:xylulokinase [Sinisalibacter aestuarii]|uniref:Xylulose kinase n=1 Tax=Sinisalibacter aestuarii TaxID=2949426 RepID=A0ABQ5LQX5_9RHOB|nr:xylulokinase [Sinisalibacter aestuarii]GKY87410.1 xylulokinase [Sinisalibacter aestuarii]